ncbi:MAG: RnfABCDGE type electron transport complex subunit D [Muribaculaceae bacterium]|nr:RnfABCDGE type electron transport complex subunit D [Muribaculaceae bacterium]
MMQKLFISLSPHVHTTNTVSRCMWNVVIALVPALLCALYFFGIGAAIVIATAVVGCVLTEYIITRYMLHQPAQLANGAAVLTGILLGFNLPSNLPVWIVLIGSVVAIGIGKMAFGGLGCNIFNPALVGRVFLLLSFPVQMTTWPKPLVNTMNYTDATTGATILSQIKQGLIEPEKVDLITNLLGQMGGSLGEVSAIALLIGFIYLLCTRVITWHIPVSIIAAAGIFSLCIGANPLVHIFSGGLLLGAIFMATDYVTSPMSHRGMLLYGAMIGIITIIIRQWGAYPEGMSFAILLMNGFTPLINRYFKPAKFGERSKK